jgi:hypothetical protein
VRLQTKTQLIFHSAYGSYAGALAQWAKHEWQVYSTFFILNDGQLIQLVDSSFHACANSTANARAVSVETEDGGNPDRFPWTPAQLNTMILLAQWVHEEHGVPLSLCARHDRPGIGIHTMWGNLGPFSPWIDDSALTCPGLARIPQFFEELMPKLGCKLRGSEVEELWARWSERPPFFNEPSTRGYP